MTHHLADRDLNTRNATCAICGPVKIRKSGTGWVCAEKAKANVRAYKARNPGRDRASRTRHVVQWQSTELRTGLCAECGPVEIVPWGRGWACAERAKELGRVNHQDTPQAYCPDCRVADGVLVWLTAEGECRRCAETNLSAELRKADDHRRQSTGLQPGLHLVGPDPYAMPEYESAVAGWRTLGGV